MTDSSTINALLEATVHGQDGEKIGRVGNVYLDNKTDEPNWVTVKTGLFGNNETFIPVDGSKLQGEELHVPYTKDFVKDAPNIDVDRELSKEEEETLYRYYGVSGHGQAGAGHDQHADRDQVARDDRAATGAGVGAAGAGVGAAGAAHDERRDVADADRHRDAEGGVVRHEEQLNVGKTTEATGKARLRKYVVTEHQTVNVPVSHEEVRVERTPLREGEVDGGKISEGEETVTLHAEKPVVNKETVGVEKVSLGKETVTENERVDADVRKEQVEIDDPNRADRRDRDDRV